MDSLQLTFAHKGRTYTQVRRSPMAAIYSVTGKSGRVLGYEVFKIKVAKERVWPNGDVTPEHESYPGDEMFGKHAWYYMNEDQARAKFREVA